MSKNLPKQAQHFAKQEIDLKHLPKTCKFLPKWSNFATSGHTGQEGPKFDA